MNESYIAVSIEYLGFSGEIVKEFRGYSSHFLFCTELSLNISDVQEKRSLYMVSSQ